MKTSLKVMVGVPAWRAVECGCTISLIMLQARAANLGLDLKWNVLEGDALVERSRSRIATAFWRSDCDVLLSVDTDIVFDAGDAARLCWLAHNRQCLVGAMYLTRNSPQPTTMVPVDLEVDFSDTGKLVEVEHLGGGFTACDRRVIRDLIDADPTEVDAFGGPGTGWFPLHTPFVQMVEGVVTYLSEDWAFSHRVRECGFRVYLDPTVRVDHIGTRALRLEDVALKLPPDSDGVTMTRRANGTLETKLWTKES